MDIAAVNLMSYEHFLDIFGNIIEKCPLITGAVWSKRPYSSIAELESCVCEFIDFLPSSDGKSPQLHSYFWEFRTWPPGGGKDTPAKGLNTPPTSLIPQSFCQGTRNSRRNIRMKRCQKNKNNRCPTEKIRVGSCGLFPSEEKKMIRERGDSAMSP
ncbi:putative 2-oxo-4-hydroxy-4-carboxy-5-ureidoimidazoline decarboxylase isoform X2 [Bombina bombina]|uniref:putative 2-oxo-4-hydroxy-4-carboxy-5-ureidoimidazoline decarboxylase isoform X2 n=1 Tax=Bombina bombina TaxID=8345 RepID=UPI00235A4A99|nr:putative 2-oxo-4-hydroxy-4-carboxy-5-ureidoimidazoline decarboxylase isoform X2 [Bombina bombina]